MAICVCGKFYNGDLYDHCYSCSTHQEEEGVTIPYTKILKQSEKAILFQLTAGILGKRAWIPLSVLYDHDEEELEFTIPKWFAEKNL
jgi:hypothetical protein